MSVAEVFLGFFYPPRCPGCDRRGADDALCAGCLNGVVPAQDQAHAPGIPRILAAASFGGVVRDLILRLKYGADTHAAPALGRLLAARIHDPADAGFPDVVVPLPLTRRRLRGRGFNQADLLARPVALALRLPLDRRILRRPRDRPPQASLDRERRLVNMAGAFEATDAAFGRAVLLVDDVATTGATLAAAAAALGAAGARRVVCAVAAQTPAHALGPPDDPAQK